MTVSDTRVVGKEISGEMFDETVSDMYCEVRKGLCVTPPVGLRRDGLISQLLSYSCLNGIRFF